MTTLTTTQLAAQLGLSKGRISQYVSSGRLDGCYRGDGRARRFDLDKVSAALRGDLDPGQMMGNGAKTKAALKEIGAGSKAPAQSQRRDGELSPKDPDRYELARIQKVEEEARRLRRLNAEADGLYVLASEVESDVAKQIGREIAEFENVLKESARIVADTLGVDFKSVRKILIDEFRAHRKNRSAVLSEAVDDREFTDAEKEADI